jgi:TonB-linked SusC/RagA family outer membrane protein
MKKILIMLILVLGCSVVFGQSGKITGSVIDNTGSPMPGVTVVVKGTTLGTVTDENGQFGINVPEANQVLVFSFVGFETQEIDIAGKSNVDIQMEASTIGLEEVVAVGYGTQKKVNLTGSVVSVDGEELAAKPVISASMALQGVAPGVTVTQSSGKPGGDGGTIRIRGIGTLGNSNPLVLIDGAEGNINGVDANDIESISVLKDASSAAIYGSRAANGVILITTKRAKAGDTKVNYRGYAGWQRFTGLPEYVDGYTYMIANNEAVANAGRTPLWSDEYMANYKEQSGLYSFEYPDVDYQDIMFTGSGLQQHHNLSISGGNDKIGSMLSLSYIDQNGQVEEYSYTRYSLRINNDYKPSDWLQFKLDLAGRISPVEEPLRGESATIESVQRLPALLAVYLPDGRYSTNFMNYSNPLALTESGTRKIDYYTFSGRLSMNIQPLKGLDVEIAYLPDFGYSYSNLFEKPIAMYRPDSAEPAMMTPSKSSLSENFSRSWTNNLHGIINYSKAINEHNITLMAGYEQIDYKTNWFRAYRENFAFTEYPVMNNGSVINMNTGGTGSEWSLQSLFGRINYDFRGKYLIEANARYDGSSRFATGNKFGFFPSFSAGWRISEENFLKNSSWIDNIKVRGSWGTLGNQNIGNYPFASVVNLGRNYTFNNTPVNGAALTNMANEDITWESTTTANVGLDFGFFGKLMGSFDYYIRNTDNILLQLPVPNIIGLTAPYQNAGKVKNTGWDFSLNYQKNTGQFNYGIGLVLSDVVNEVVDLKGSGPYIGGYTVTREGDPIGALYMYESDGLYRTDEELANAPTQFGKLALGDIRYVDQLTVDTDGDGIFDAGDGKINASDRVIVGSNIPRYNFGLNLDAKFKGFDFLVFFQGVGKRETYLDGYNGWTFFNFSNIQKYQLDAFNKETNPNGKMPRLIDATSHNNFQSSDFYTHNAAYLRIKTLQVGYTIPSKISRLAGLSKTRIYFSGNNLFTFHHMPKGWDPEQSMGYSNNYPIVGTKVFGLDISL